MSEPLCSVCKTAVAAFDGFILFLFLVFVFVLIVFLEKKEEFFNTAPDADDIICCSLVYVVVDSSFARVVKCVCLNRVFCYNGEQNVMR